MDHYKSNIRALLQRYRDGECSQEELEYLHRELSNDNDDVDQVLWESLLQEVDTAKLSDQKFENLYQKISSKTITTSDKWTIRRLIPFWAAAALIICLGGLYLYNDTFQKSTREPLQYTKLVDVAPGSNKAMLKTADGSVIVLNEAQTGIIMGDEIIYSNGSEVAQVTESSDALEVLYELSTPNGGTYRVTLDDGSTVWLNAASKLIYPSKFNQHERKVVIEGEAYFEIQKDPKRPFKVTSGDQTVEVLGTTFNVNAYPDARVVRTTLVEGKVKVGQNRASSSSVFLHPGQQSILEKDSGITVKQVNLMGQVGWREGLFYFDETALTDAMLQISRWYDIEIRYEGNVSQTYFYGQIPRSKSLKNVLNILEEGNVRFRLTKEKTKNILTVLSAQ